MLFPVMALAASCVVLGIAAPLGVVPSLRAATSMSGASADLPREALSFVRDATWISGVAFAVLAVAALAWVLRRSLLARRVVRTADTWGCGYLEPTARMQYTASSFASPLLSAFGRLSGVREHRTLTRFETHPLDLVLDRIALPLWSAIQRAALRLRPIQQGRLHFYLLYVMVTLVVLLAYLAVTTR
jgi:hydrogenase-4 component B